MIIKNKTCLTLKEIYQICDIVSDELEKNNIRHRILISNVYLKKFEREYDDCFIYDERNSLILLKKEMSIKQLQNIAANSPVEIIDLMYKKITTINNVNTIKEI